MGAVTSWDNLPTELVSVIAHKVDSLESLKILSAVCKSWYSAVSEFKLLLPPRDPWLLLAEDNDLDLTSILVTELEAISCMVYVDNNYIDDNVDVGQHLANNQNHGGENNEDEGGENNDIDIDDHDDFQIAQIDRIIPSIADLFQNFSSRRGFYSPAKKKTYYLDLPEAAGKSIFGTNQGWLVTLGRDLEINLLHPFMRYQIPLPPMLALPYQYEYDDDFWAQEVYTMFLKKVVMSSQVPITSEDTCNLPTIMAIHGEYRLLGFARLGDKLWKPVECNTRVFDDIVYHKNKFYAIDCHWTIFMCDIVKDDKREGQCSRGIEITSIPLTKEEMVQGYLIESVSGSHLWVVVRFRNGEYYGKGFEPPTPGKLRYYTSSFLVFKLEIQCTNFDDIPSCQWSGKVTDVSNETLFIGRNSSASVASSGFIKPNSIYFSDDEDDLQKDGQDMGIFDIRTGRIEPHFPGTSLHPFSPPVWYI